MREGTEQRSDAPRLIIRERKETEGKKEEIKKQHQKGIHGLPRDHGHCDVM